MNSYEGNESIVSNNEFNNDTTLKNIDFNSWLQLKFQKKFNLRSFLRSAQIVKPSPVRGELQVHLSRWLSAEQVAPLAQGLF